MAKYHRVTVNDESFVARSGQVLLEAALLAGVEMPHDCRAGRCGTCVTRVRNGITLGGETLQPGMLHACQAMVFSDLDLTVESLPPKKQIKAVLARVDEVCHDVVELTIVPSEPLEILPGQYCRFAFKGFPARPFSPTAPLDGGAADDCIRLNVKRVRDGRVSTSLGTKISAGHPLTILGPFGHAFLRPQKEAGASKRLVLVAGGTGFAPVWAIATAALKENPGREIAFVVGVKQLASLYMAEALTLASRFANVSVTAVSEERKTGFARIKVGRPQEHLPKLGANDVIYACGAPAMVTAVAAAAGAVDATFYADPFEAGPQQGEDWVAKAVSWLRTG